MPREAGLFEQANGSPLEGYLLLRTGGGNIPPAWVGRARESRKNREARLVELLQAKSLDALPVLRDWEVAFRKECFYRGIRTLMELERTGESDF